MMLYIVYRDEYLVAVNKPAGMLVHPTGHGEGDEWIVMKCLRDQLGCHVYPVHRLDRPTSGVLIFGLNALVAASLQQLFERRLVKKVYHAVVSGCPHEDWVCEQSLARDESSTVCAAKTDFKVLARSSGTAEFRSGVSYHFSLIQAIPYTGRFHQIRRHLAASGYPIVGDFRYAGESLSFELCVYLGIDTRMLLHASSLSFVHPMTEEELRVNADYDEVFTSGLSRIEWDVD